MDGLTLKPALSVCPFACRGSTRRRYGAIISAIGSALFFTAAILTLFLPRGAAPARRLLRVLAGCRFTIRPQVTTEGREWAGAGQCTAPHKDRPWHAPGLILAFIRP